MAQELLKRVRYGLDKTPRCWHLFDAQGQSVGRLAQAVARLLVGKHKPNWDPGFDSGDWVVVLNAEQVAIDNKRWKRKKYYTHSGYPGALKTIIAKDLHERYPQKILKFAVSGMLPKNRHREARLERLKLVLGSDNPYAKHFENATYFEEQLTNDEKLMLRIKE